MAKRRSQRQRVGREPARASDSRSSGRDVWRLGLIALVALIAYANSVGGPFVFDDRATVLENASIRDLTALQVFTPHREIPTAGRPLVNLSHALNYAVNGTDPRGYHILNLVLHV